MTFCIFVLSLMVALWGIISSPVGSPELWTTKSIRSYWGIAHVTIVGLAITATIVSLRLLLAKD